jgi:hypothetical protein
MHIQVATLPQRTSRPGTQLSLVVLAAEPGGCIAVDLDSGALVRAGHPGVWSDPPAPYDLVQGTLGDPTALVFDPARPEAVLLEAPPRRVGRLPRWRVERYLRSLRHPRARHLLGWAGPAVAYWTLDGAHPSAGIVEPQAGPAVLRRPAGQGGRDQLRCRFAWADLVLDLPVTDLRVAAALERSGAPALSGGALGRVIGGPPRHLVIALTPPVAGHCYKVVAAILPRP